MGPFSLGQLGGVAGCQAPANGHEASPIASVKAHSKVSPPRAINSNVRGEATQAWRERPGPDYTGGPLADYTLVARGARKRRLWQKDRARFSDTQV